MALVVLCTKLKRELNKDLGAACIIRCSDRNIANYPPLGAQWVSSENISL